MNKCLKILTISFLLVNCSAVKVNYKNELDCFFLNNTAKDKEELVLVFKNNTSSIIAVPFEEKNYYLNHLCLDMKNELKSGRLSVRDERDSLALLSLKINMSNPPLFDTIITKVKYDLIVIKPKSQEKVKFNFSFGSKCGENYYSYVFQNDEKYYLKYEYFNHNIINESTMDSLKSIGVKVYKKPFESNKILIQM